ncbi:hypothetical protein [Acanthopleuribacter pedis]|uniref:Transmembrane protein n=1 Tax=Acanthopleuribacter pedis TaxID=442870 RepID=A0A8J7QFY4_9BACT|nr:hypothetical protein [Acanthopleuribacter pedis]MBO1317843.1 hypothetical protein [Acanthopleuribacter pedis]
MKRTLSTSLASMLQSLPVLAPWLLLKWLLNVLVVAAMGIPLAQFLRRQLASAPDDWAMVDGRFQRGFWIEWMSRHDLSEALLQAATAPWLVLFALGNLVLTAALLSSLCGPSRETFAVNLVAGFKRFPALAVLVALFGAAGYGIFIGLGQSVFPSLAHPSGLGTMAEAGSLATRLALPTFGLSAVLLLFWFDASRVHLFRRYPIEQDIPGLVAPLWWLVKPLVAVVVALVNLLSNPLKPGLVWLILLAVPAALAVYQQIETSEHLLPLWWVQVLVLGRMMFALLRLSFMRFWFDPRERVAQTAAADTGAGAFDGLEQYTETTEPGVS